MAELVSVVHGDDDDVLHDVTDQEFTLFKVACYRYQKQFSLMDWDLYFCMEDLSEDAEMANISWCFTGHSVRITLSSKMPQYDDYSSELDKIARHEIIHLLLARIQEYSQRRNVIQADIDESIESLVRMIDNVYLSAQQQCCDDVC